MTAVSNSIVHLTMRFNNTVLSYGTGVIYKHESGFHIVTAWHNLSGRNSETLQLLSETAAVPNNVIVTIPVETPGYITTRIPIILPLEDDDKALFYIHPENSPRVDVAVIPFDPEQQFRTEMHVSTGECIETTISPIMNVEGIGKTEICPIQKYLLPDNDVLEAWFGSVQVTEDLFIPGYPNNVHDYYAQPVWKRATIASSLQIGWNREPKFLIDTASKSGMSGAPVLYFSPHGTIDVSGKKYGFDREIAILAGIYVGRLAVKKDMDPQIGTVWHLSVIDEIIEGREWENLSYDIVLTHDELIDSMASILDGVSTETIDNILDNESPSRFYVRNELLKKVNSRASGADALEAVLEATKNYKATFDTSEPSNA